MSNEVLIRRLAAIVGDAAVLSGADADAHLTDWRGRYTGRARCVAKPAAVNRQCATILGTVVVNVDRFIGESTARPATADVCLPE